MTPNPGQIVRVRTRRYLVDEVVPPPREGDQTLVRMSCLDDDNQGAPLDVLWEKELDAKILDASSWKRVAEKGFDPPDLFAAYYNSLRWNLVTATDPRLFQAPYRAGIQVDAYQLEPLQKALRLPRVNLFIADDVGLGKTIESGLILRELIMRQKVRRVVVMAPPSIVPQWKEEMETRFGLTFQVMDRDYFAATRRERGYGVNPFDTNNRFIISHALLRDETYAGPLRDWLGDFAPGSLLILDEAHHAAPAVGGKYAVDSQFTRAVRDLAHRFEHRLFLSATPHNGHSNSFSALLEILDPQRFCRGVRVRESSAQKDLRTVMVRRLKEDLRKIGGGFPRRNVVPVRFDDLPPDTPALKLADLLSEYAELRTERLKSESRSKQSAANLVLTNLQKRLFSSVEAFWYTLKAHRRAVARQREKSDPERQEALFDSSGDSILRQAPGADDEYGELSDEDLRSEEESEMQRATAVESSGAERTERELSLLEEMHELATASRYEPDSRIEWMVEWIRENLCPQVPALSDKTSPSDVVPEWAPRRLLIFTEYTDTKRYLEQQLREAMGKVDQNADRIATFHGGMGEKSRERIKRAFNSDPNKDPLRILIATDAAREGINLQSYCADLVHFDLPWNPSRLEQRNGRIDRKQQNAEEVNCYYFVYKQRDEDRVLETLVRKTETIREELGSLSPVIQGRLEARLAQGIRRGEVSKLEAEIEDESVDGGNRQTVEEELEEARERDSRLRSKLDELRTQLGKAKDYLGLDDDKFRSSISAALRMMNAPELAKTTTDEGRAAWKFPPLHEQVGADSGWTQVMDALREPAKEGAKLWELRDRPLRPVVFEDTGRMDNDVVHLHLEHKVAQRLLNRFLAQGFVHDDLSRACVGQANDAIPRVILLGRLSLYGPNATRLHDEIVPVTARWIDRKGAGGTLSPYAAETEAKTLDLLETAIVGESATEVSDVVRTNLLEGVEQDVTELLPHLEERARAVAERSKALLAERGEKEANAMVEILERQRKQIESTLSSVESQQMSIEFRGWKESERKQLEADKRHWQRRLSAIDEELVTEPKRIRESYENKADRIDPVGIVYLWPVTG